MARERANARLVAQGKRTGALIFSSQVNEDDDNHDNRNHLRNENESGVGEDLFSEDLDELFANTQSPPPGKDNTDASHQENAGVSTTTATRMMGDDGSESESELDATMTRSKPRVIRFSVGSEMSHDGTTSQPTSLSMSKVQQSLRKLADREGRTSLSPTELSPVSTAPPSMDRTLLRRSSEGSGVLLSNNELDEIEQQPLAPSKDDESDVDVTDDESTATTSTTRNHSNSNREEEEENEENYAENNTEEEQKRILSMKGVESQSTIVALSASEEEHLPQRTMTEDDVTPLHEETLDDMIPPGPDDDDEEEDEDTILPTPQSPLAVSLRSMDTPERRAAHSARGSGEIMARAVSPKHIREEGEGKIDASTSRGQPDDSSEIPTQVFSPTFNESPTTPRVDLNSKTGVTGNHRNYYADNEDDDDQEGEGYQMALSKRNTTQQRRHEDDDVVDETAETVVSPATPTVSQRKNGRSTKDRKRGKKHGKGEQADEEDLRTTKTVKNTQRSKKKGTVTFSPKGIQAGPLSYTSVPVTEDKETPEQYKGLRRSKRTRVSPLAFWKNERAEYGPNNFDLEMVESRGLIHMPQVKYYLKAEPTPYKKRKLPDNNNAKVAKRNRTNMPDDNDDEEEEFDSSKVRKKYPIIDGDSAYVWDDIGEQAEKLNVVGFKDKMIVRRLPITADRQKGESRLTGLASQAFNVSTDDNPFYPGYIMGNLTLPPRAIKDAESVGACAQTFTVVFGQRGALEVSFGDPNEDEGVWTPKTAQRFLLSPGDVFRVPPGNCYRIENHSKTKECFLTWTIIRANQAVGEG